MKNDESKIAEQKKNMVIAQAIHQLGLDPEEIWEPEAILEVILAQDNLLNLAHAMMLTRNDWNDGDYRVRSAIFDPGMHPTHIEIINSVKAAMEQYDDDNDGRVYRDCKWNYNEIYAYVKDEDPDLYRIYNKIIDYVDID